MKRPSSRNFLFLATGMLVSAGVLGAFSMGTKMPEPSTADINAQEFSAMQGLLSVNSIWGTYNYADEDKFVVFTTLNYENGKLVDCGGESYGPRQIANGPKLLATALWGNYAGDNRLALNTTGLMSVTYSHEKFWPKLDGGRMANVSGHGGLLQSDGYVILAFATSQEPSTLSPPEHVDDARSINYGDFKEALRNKHYVGVLAVKTFKTKEEMQDSENALSTLHNTYYQAHREPSAE